MSRKLYKALQSNKVKPQLKEVRGILGLSIGGSKLVDVPTRKGYVYVRIRDNQSEVIQAQNRTVSPIYDLPVTIVKDGLRWTIKGMDDGKYGNWASPAAYLPKHGYSHSLSRENGTGADPVWIYPDQFMPLLVYPSGSAGGLNVAPYVLKTGNSWKYVGGTGTPNLLAHKPSSSGTLVGLVYMNTDTGNPGYLIASGSLAYNNPTTIQGLVNYIPYPASNQEPLYAFTMTSGSSGVEWENIFNVRQFYGNLITGTSTVAQTQAYEDASLLTGTFASTSIIDVAGLSITKTLENNVKYRWKVTLNGYFDTVANAMYLYITDSSNNNLNATYVSSGVGYATQITVEYVETGTGASVTRKVRAKIDPGSTYTFYTSPVVNKFYVERTG